MDNVFSRKDLGLMRISAFRDFPFDGENPVGLSRKQRQLSGSLVEFCRVRDG
jgi:hypothetical protein